MALVLPSCNNIINYPAPTIQALQPPSKNAGDSLFTLTVTGYKFTPASQILWNGSLQFVTFFQSINILTAQVPASLIQNPGTALISVFTPQPGGGTTSTLPFAINPQTPPVPSISSISPTSVLAGSNPFQLFITGSNFVPLSSAAVNGDNRAVTVVNSTQLNVPINSTDIASAGQVQIVVVNPAGPASAPGGGSSNPVNLIVTNPVPAITSLSPADFTAGTAATTGFGITGSSFVPSSIIEIDGSPRTTAFVSNTQVETQLTAGDFAVGGSHQVRVVNPGPGGGSSNILAFAVDPTLTIGLPVLIDVGLNGAEANQGVCGQNCGAGPLTLATAGPSISSGGSAVAFASTSTNFFLHQANAGSDIFIRTTCLGSSCAPVTSDVSIGPNRIASNGSSSEPSIDSTAAHVAFTSTATNLVAGIPFAQNIRQVYWLPVCSASAATCSPGELVSISADGINPGNGESYNPSLSPDGRYVAFVSLATNLVSGVTTLDGVTPQVFVHDTCNGPTNGVGCTPTTYLVSTPDGTTPGNAPSSEPSVSSSGTYVSFTSSASNFGATAPNPNSSQEIFLRTTCLVTTTCTGVTTLVSTPDGVTPANSASSESKIVSGGRFIAFASTATNLVAGAGPVQQIYMFDTCLSAATGCSPSATLISTPDGTTPGNGFSEYPSIAQGSSVSTTTTVGEFVAFASKSSNLGFNTANGVENIFIRKTCLGFASTITTCDPVTVLASQPPGTNPPQSNGDSLIPAISGDCHTVAFLSSANNLVPNDTNSFANVFLALTTF